MKGEKTNKMGVLPVPKCLIQMGIPVILSMVLQAMYNIVDSMFVARMADVPGIPHTGELAVNALTLAFPVQMLMIAFGIGTGVGMGAMISRQLGEGKKENAAKTAGNGIFLALVIYVAFLFFAFFGIDPYLKTQTSNTAVLEMGHQYLMICTVLGAGSLLFGIYEKMLQATGKTNYSTISQVVGAATNIVMDPILIYGLGFFPVMGIRGAAIATVLGQFVSLGLNMFFHYRKNKEVLSGWKYLKPDRHVIRGIYSIGFSAIVMQALMSVMTYGVNIIFGGFSESAVTAYGIFYKIQQFVYFAGFGLRDSITPLVAYNYGAKSQKRVKEGIRWGIVDTMIVMAIGVAVLQLFCEPLAAVFGLSDRTAELCVLAMRIISPGFLAAGINIASQGVFQALQAGNSSLIVSLLRLLVVPLPLCAVFTHVANADTMIWLAFPIGEAVAAVVAIILLLRVWHKRVIPMEEQEIGMKHNQPAHETF